MTNEERATRIMESVEFSNATHSYNSTKADGDALRQFIEAEIKAAQAEALREAAEGTAPACSRSVSMMATSGDAARWNSAVHEVSVYLLRRADALDSPKEPR
jgi:hypothetical protein